MAREKEFYRENLELLNARFPDHDMLTLPEVMQVMGWGDRRTVRTYLGEHITPDRKISKNPVARFMCGGVRN